MKGYSKNGLAVAIATAIALGLTACGGGGTFNKTNSGGGTPVGNPGTPTTPGTPGTPAAGTVQQDLALKALSAPTVSGLATASPTMPVYSEHLKLINADQSYANNLKGAGVTIAILDSGVNTQHPTLKGRVNYSLFALDPADNDKNVDYVKPHGTVVAELAAGTAYDKYGGGVAPAANIASVRMIQDKDPVDDGSGKGNEITPEDGDGMGAFLAEVHTRVADAGAKISNNSWGGLYWNDPAVTPGIISGFSDFILKRDGIVVFANGNSGDYPTVRPNPSDMASLPSMSADAAKLERGWLTVAALDPANPAQLTSWSQECGRAMNYCLAAPGMVTYIGADGASYYRGGGTSYAAPLVSGAAAVVWSAFPYFNNDLVRQTILGTAKDLGAPGVDTVFGYGLLDVGKAIKGPGQFNWGNVTVAPSGNSVWRNTISGAGGLIKEGGGTLTLTETQSYTGGTTVNAGALDVRNGLGSNLTVSSNGLVYAAGTFNGTLTNAGKFFADANQAVTIKGDFSQAATGNLGYWVGNPISVTGNASLDGQLSILGQKSGYVSKSKETVLNALGTLSGTFASVKTASNVFLDATLSYDSHNAYLNVSRLQVTSLAIDNQMPASAVAGATRVESAMSAIDAGQVDNANFVLGAAALQNARDMGEAARSLQSLNGQLHSASAALTFESLDAGRRSLSARLDEIADNAQASRAWQHSLQSNGTTAANGFSAMGMSVSGTMAGYDMKLGRNSVAGMAYSTTESSGWLSDSGDRTRGRQTESQVYAGWFNHDLYVRGALGAGRFDRQVERTLQLGVLGEGVMSHVRGDYAFANLEGGYALHYSGFKVTPYAGAQYALTRNNGFNEGGITGFGLRSDGWRADRLQAIAGVHAAREWVMANGWTLALDLRSEWQSVLAAHDGLDASFTGLNAWMPVQGMGFAKHGALYGLGLNARFGERNLLRLDMSQRNTSLGDNRAVMLQYQRGF